MVSFGQHKSAAAFSWLTLIHRYIVLPISVIGILDCTGISASKLNTATAPTAPVLREGKTFIGVLDSASAVPQTVCFAAERSGSFVVVLTVDDSNTAGEWAVVDQGAQVQDRATFSGSGQADELHGIINSNGIGACVEVLATRGLSIYRLHWYFR